MKNFETINKNGQNNCKIWWYKKSFKYLIGYKVLKKIRPLCTFLPKMSAYRTDFDETK